MILTGIDCVNSNRIDIQSHEMFNILSPKILEFVSEKIHRVCHRQRSVVGTWIVGNSLDGKVLPSDRMEEAIALVNDGIKVHRGAPSIFVGWLCSSTTEECKEEEDVPPRYTTSRL